MPGERLRCSRHRPPERRVPKIALYRFVTASWGTSASIAVRLVRSSTGWLNQGCVGAAVPDGPRTRLAMRSMTLARGAARLTFLGAIGCSRSVGEAHQKLTNRRTTAVGRKLEI